MTSNGLNVAPKAATWAIKPGPACAVMIFLALAMVECCYGVRTAPNPFHCCEAILRPRYIDLSMIFYSHGGNSKEYPRCKVKRKEWLTGCHGETALTRSAFMRLELTVSARHFGHGSIQSDVLKQMLCEVSTREDYRGRGDIGIVNATLHSNHEAYWSDSNAMHLTP